MTNTARDYEESAEGIPSAERNLWQAIVAQVIRDLLAPDNLVTATDRSRALSWLTSPSGDYARDRQIACAFAGQDGDLLRKKIIAIMNGAPPPPFESFRGARNVAVTVEEARALWRAQTRPTPKPAVCRPPPAQPPRRPDGSQIIPPKRRLTAVPPSEPIPVPEGNYGEPLSIPDDPFFPTHGMLIRASRPWADGEVSRFLGPLPSIHSNLGRLLWDACQSQRVGRNRVTSFSEDVDALVQELADTFPTCDVCWSAKGVRLPSYRPNAALRLYLKQVAKAA